MTEDEIREKLARVSNRKEDPAFTERMERNWRIAVEALK